MSGGDTRAGTVSVRPADGGDRDFVLAFVERFSDFPLPPGRDRAAVNAGVRADLERHLDGGIDGSHFFVAEIDGQRAGFIHLQLVADFFGGTPNCHVSDLAVEPAFEGRGLARRLLAHAETFARDHACTRLTLAVFPGNERARRLYEREGFAVDLLRMGRPL